MTNIKRFTVALFASLLSTISASACDFGSSISGGRCRGYLTTPGSGSFTVPADWSAVNTTETIGGGGGGSSSQAGGGGAAYAIISNTSLVIGNMISYQVGSAGASSTGTSGGDTYFNGTGATCSSQAVCAKGGDGGADGVGSGGSAASSLGATKFSGGNATSDAGGGSAGLNGAGGNASGSTGGTGDNGFGGAGGTTGVAGGNGTEWDASHGSGGGGGEHAAGGSYGAGGGFNGTTPGFQGLIVITYTPGSGLSCVHTLALMGAGC